MSGAAYSVFGLTVVSDLDLPELIPASGGVADVRIVLGRVAVRSDARGYHMANGAEYHAPSIGRFAMRGGREIVVDPDPDCSPRTLRVHLLGSVLGAILHQRRVLPLHANAVEMDGRAVAFMGPSGAGKSTLAGWFTDRGCRLLSDDVCAVRIDEAKVWAEPGIPRLRLWREALLASGRTPEDHHPSVEGRPDYDKFDVALPVDRVVRGPLPLAGIYVLERGEQDLHRLRGVEAVSQLMVNTYRPGFLRAAGHQADHWRVCAALAERVPVFRITRPWSVQGYADHAERIEEHARSVAAAAGQQLPQRSVCDAAQQSMTHS